MPDSIIQSVQVIHSQEHFFSRFVKILRTAFAKPHWLNSRMKDIGHPTSHCQYSLTSQASLDVAEKYVLVYQAAELDETNGRTWMVYADPKKTEASTIKALQFLAGSHLAWKPLDSTLQKEKQTETQWPCDTCPPSSPCRLSAWRSLDSSVHSAQEEAPGSEGVLMEVAAVPVVLPRLTHSHQMGRAWVCTKALAQLPWSTT